MKEEERKRRKRGKNKRRKRRKRGRKEGGRRNIRRRGGKERGEEKMTERRKRRKRGRRKRGTEGREGGLGRVRKGGNENGPKSAFTLYSNKSLTPFTCERRLMLMKQKSQIGFYLDSSWNSFV